MTEPKIKPFDASEFLTSEEDIEEYLRQAVEANDPELLVSALCDIAKARELLKSLQNHD